MRTRISRPPRWQARFLKALAETGNVRLASDKAKVNNASVYRKRQRDPEFAADMEAARAQANTRLANEDRPTPSGARWDSDGSALIITQSANGVPRRTQRAGPNGWTRAEEKRFLDTLATTCNVTMACAAAGHNRPSAYTRRNKWTPFAKEWAEALKIGLQAMEVRLLYDAIDQTDNYYIGVPREIRPGRFDEAIRLLSFYEKRRGHQRVAWNRAPVDVEAVKESIIRKAEALGAAEARRKAKKPLWE
ncbi:hypothetical protein [Sphingorhabdus sp.]|uniref:hypothetical protein n=1 Tax=Sphingorhabdus sp. TaxID=1902408 RepID=UPI003593CBE4